MSALSKTAPLAFAAILAFGAGTAQAALLFDETLIPGSPDGDTTFFDADNDFSENFVFSHLDIATIDRFELTLEVSGANDESGLLFGFIPVSEDWQVRAQGSNSSSSLFGSLDDDFDDLSDGTNTITYDASTDGFFRDVFAHSVATQTFTIWLSEGSADGVVPNPSITISSARLQVFGELAPIPVPAALPLLALGLGGLGYAARRQRGTRKA